MFWDRGVCLLIYSEKEQQILFQVTWASHADILFCVNAFELLLNLTTVPTGTEETILGNNNNLHSLPGKTLYKILVSIYLMRRTLKGLS